MLITIEGIYKDGQIELNELPNQIADGTQVLVTFIEPNKIDVTKLRQLIERLETNT
ncbi:MAG: hypothetical protein KME29_33145 [Calothrix sp. FI2-JRJ7]|jgi:hypothetical protein|nr:hypothetical protein [Calothrix sp. FI2-JRJ7]